MRDNLDEFSTMSPENYGQCSHFIRKYTPYCSWNFTINPYQFRMVVLWSFEDCNCCISYTFRLDIFYHFIHLQKKDKTYWCIFILCHQICCSKTNKPRLYTNFYCSIGRLNCFMSLPILGILVQYFA
jgi:hypothetical protein